MKKIILFLCALCASTVAFGQLKVQSDGTAIVGYESDFGSTYRLGLGKPFYVCTVYTGLNGTDVYSSGRWYFEIGGTSSASTFQIKRGGTECNAPNPPFFYMNHGGSVGIGKIPVSNAKLDVSGSIYLNGTTIVTSDERLKSDIRGIDDLVPKIYELEGKSYQKRLPDSTETFFEYGFLAQELQRQFPDLVVRTSDGYLGVNYIALIPVIVEALKSQKQEIEELNERIFALERALNSNAVPNNAPTRPQQETEQQGITNQSAALFQNTPNPFNENTEIAFYLPQSVANAMLCVYDMNGRQLSQNVITQRGSSVFVVNGSQYGAGMYLYSLIADNQIVDTKRMILTK